MTKQAFYLTVDSTKHCEVGKTYTTTNYKMFKLLKYNRGEDNSIVAAKVNAFKKLYASGKFYTNIVHVIINMFDEVMDGHHKLKMAEELSIPINFIITPEADFNSPSLSVKLNAISKLNAFTSKWDGKANFLSAVKTKEPLAIAILKLQGSINTIYGINSKILTASRIITLLTKDVDGLASKSMERDVYCRKEYLPILQSDAFMTEMEFICETIKYILSWNMRNPEITPFFIIRNVMPRVWDNKLNMKEFYHFMVKTGFKNVGNTMRSTGKWVDEISAKKVSKKAELIAW
jgi:hypothetical protein